MGTITLLTINKEKILEWINTGSLIAFVIVVAACLILLLRGLLRGWKAGTYRFIALGLFFAVPLLFLGPIATALGGINLGQWIHDPIVLNFSNGSTVSVPVTTVFETAYQFVYAFLHDGMHVSASASTIANYSIALAGSLIRLTFVSIWALISLTLGSALITLLWHIGFKFILPKRIRRPTKRWISSIEEAAAFLSIAILGIAPLSGLVNAAKNNAKIPDSSNETVMLVRDVLDTYDNSIFNKAFFAWTRGSGVDTLDTQIAQFFATNNYIVDGRTYEANVVKEVRVLSNVEGSLATLLVSDQPQQSLVSSVLHSSLLVGQTFYSIAQGDNELLNTLVPLAYHVAENVDFLQEEYANEDLSFPFLASKQARVRAFDQIALSNYVRAIEADDSFLPVYDGMSMFSKNAVERIDEKMSKDAKAHEYVNAVVSGYVYQDFLNNGDSPFTELLPLNAKGELDDDRFGQIDWFREAHILRAAQDSIIALPKAAASSSAGEWEQMLNDYLAAASKHMPEIIKILVGERDESGKPVVNDKGDSKEGLCLLDSDLIAGILPAGMQVGAYFLNENVLTDVDDPDDFLDRTSAIADGLMGDMTKPSECKINYKEELGHVLDLVGDLTKNEAGQNFIAHYKDHPGLEFTADGTLLEIDPGISEALMAGIVNLDKSKFLSYMTPVLGDHFVRPMLKTDGSLGKMGITKLDFSVPSLGARLADILAAGKYCNEMIASFGALFRTDGGGQIDANSFFSALTNYETEGKHYQATHLLDILTSSPILNPEYEISGKKVTNYNIASLLQYFLKDLDTEGKIQITYETLDGIQLSSQWQGDQIVSKGDNYYTVQVFKQIAESGVIEELASLSSSSATEAIQSLSQVGVDKLFANIGHSQVLRKVLPPFFDTNLLGTLLNSENVFDLEAMGITYKNLTTPEAWEREGIAMQAILNLAANGLDISSLDVFDPAVIELMRDLAKSNVFLMPDGTYVFGNYFTDKLLLSITDYSQFKLFTDYPDKIVEGSGGKTVAEYLAAKGESYWKSQSAAVVADKKAVCSVFVRAMALPQEPADWDAELLKIGKVISSLNSLGGISGMSEFKAESLPALLVALQDLCDLDTLGTVLPANVFNKAIESGSVSSAVKTENANVGWLYRNAEDFVAAMETNGYDRTSPNVKPFLTARDNELAYMVSLVKLAVNSDVIKTGTFDFATLDPNGLLRPLFYAARSSKILHPTSVNDLYSPTQTLPEMTIFEDLVLTFVKNSGVYIFVDPSTSAETPTLPDDKAGVYYLKGTQKTLKSVIKSLTENNRWTEETNALCNLVEVLQNSSFLKAGQISFDVFSTKEDLRDFFSKAGSKEELIDLIVALEQSELYYRCLPVKLESAINDALVGVTFGHLAEDIACADFYLYENPGDKSDFPRYVYEGPNNTVEGLVDVLAALSACTDLDLTDLSTVNVGSLAEALRCMALSPIFNSNTTNSASVFAGVAPERQGMTSFQALFCDVLNVDALTGHYYYAESPKDIANAANYTDATTKTAYVIKSLFPALDGTNAAAVENAADQYIVQEFGNLLEVCKQDRFSEFFGTGPNGGDFGALDEDAFCSLLNALNECTLLRDCVPNGAHKTLVDGSVINIDGIAMKSADVFFSYYYYDDDGKFSSTRRATPNYDMPFYPAEIDQLAMIYTALKENKDSVSDMKLETLDPILIRNILLDLHDSYVFHEARKDARLDQNDVASIGYEYFEDLTVFEQFMYKIMLKSNIHSINYSPSKFFQYTFEENWDYILANPGTYTPTRTGIVGAFYKAHDDIMAITVGGDNWLDEINAFTTDGKHHAGAIAGDPIVGIIAAGQDAGLFDASSSAVSVDFDTMSAISPDKIRGLLYAINESKILNSALGISMGSLLGTNSADSGIGLNAYSEKTFSLALGSTVVSADTIDMNQAAVLFDDGDNSSFDNYHAVNMISVPTDGDVSGKFKALYHVNATSTLDMTSLIACNFEAGVTTFVGPADSAIPVPLEITLTGGNSFTGAADFVVDYANYYLDQDTYRGDASTGVRGTIDVIGYLLSSAYRGELGGNNRYFSFNNVPATENALSMFFDDYEKGTSSFDHSTYGLLLLFSDSGFYETGLDADGNFTSGVAHHTASAYALYNALLFEINAPDIEIEVGGTMYYLPSETELALGNLIGKGVTASDHIAKLEGYLGEMTTENMDQVVKEAFWFDNYATSAGTFDAYNELHQLVLNSGAYGYPMVQSALELAIDQKFVESSGMAVNAVDEMRKLLSSTVYAPGAKIDIPLSDTVLESHEFGGQGPDLGLSVVANIINHSGALKYGSLCIDYEAPTLLFGTSKKNTRTDLTGFNDDMFGVDEDYAPMTANYLAKVDACYGLMQGVYASTDQKAAIKAGFELLGDGVQNDYAELFYLASLYDVMINPSNVNHVYHFTSPTDLSDLPFWNAKGNVNGVMTDLSFQTVAALYA